MTRPAIERRYHAALVRCAGRLGIVTGLWRAPLFKHGRETVLALRVLIADGAVLHAYPYECEVLEC